MRGQGVYFLCGFIMKYKLRSLEVYGHPVTNENQYMKGLYSPSYKSETEHLIHDLSIGLQRN